MAEEIEEFVSPPPSSNWTPEERLGVIATLVGSIKYFKPQMLAWFDIKERIFMVATQSSKFLEDNRRSVLEGTVLWENKNGTDS